MISDRETLILAARVRRTTSDPDVVALCNALTDRIIKPVAIEGELLQRRRASDAAPAQEVAASRLGGLHLQGQMHALVAAVLLRATGLDALDLDSEPEPPDGEL
jgi:hypothetical protein